MPMPTDRNTDPSLIYVLLAMVVICCVTILSRCVFEPAMQNVSNDLVLQQAAGAFDTLRHPGQSGRVAV